MEPTTLSVEPQTILDVTVLEPVKKHPAIFDRFDALADGESFILHNDHDPKPVYYELMNSRGATFSWDYLQKDPLDWDVRITKKAVVADGDTVGKMAARDPRYAAVFHRLGIDYCCGGKRSVEEAAMQKGLDVLRVREELSKATAQAGGPAQHNFDDWSLSFLADYIVNVHHGYVRRESPVLLELSEKVAGKHGDDFPWMRDVLYHVRALTAELTTHMKKEEAVLFPYVKALEAGTASPMPFGSVQQPVWMMEADHEEAGELLRAIREATSDFTPPEKACNSFRLLLHKLEAFEADLHQHIHLENNILFPKAVALEGEGKAEAVSEGAACSLR